ncbi:DUF6177 family protein [Streptomyces sp. NPDC001817]|uniref:DUF6177 family protein n=1 Tax=Streptomyces sp. NPDC001817 TaxID=3154398 RepID=UPI003320AD21
MGHLARGCAVGDLQGPGRRGRHERRDHPVRTERAGCDGGRGRLGPTARPALHHPLGDGTDFTSWQRLEQLNDHLKAAAD